MSKYKKPAWHHLGKNDAGVPILMSIVWPGDKYGLDRGLINKGEPLIEFYDKRYPMHGEPGQFVSRYLLSTFRDHDSRHGINLHGGVSGWHITPTQYRKARGIVELMIKDQAMRNPQLPSTVVPAHGRDYRTKKDAVAGFESGEDWIISDFFNPWDGKPISIRDFPPGSSVILRFSKLRRTAKYTVPRSSSKLRNPGKKKKAKKAKKKSKAKAKSDPSDWPDSKLPTGCFHFVPESKKLVLIQRGSGGYMELSPTLFMQYPKRKGETHHAYAKRMNKEMWDVGPAVAEEMVMRSMFKWG